MEKEIELEIIKATQNSLGKYVKRPPLSEKLLKKPPFRFLHDIITVVLRTTGFFEGLFDENELISDNVKDRESKILFLNKVISVLSITTGKTLSVKSSKIVAGQEPEKTNELLQCLALALDKKLSSDEAVKKIKENSKSQVTQTRTKDNTKSVKKNNDPKQLTSKSSEKLTSKRDHNEKPVSKNEKSTEKSKKKENGQVKQVKGPQSKTTIQKELPNQQSRSVRTKRNLEQNSNTGAKNVDSLSNLSKNAELPVTDQINESHINDKEDGEENKQVLSEEEIKNEPGNENINDNNREGKLNAFDSTLAEIEPKLNLLTDDLTGTENNTREILSDKKDVVESAEVSFDSNVLHIDNKDFPQSNDDPAVIKAEDNLTPQVQQINLPIKQASSDINSTASITVNSTIIKRPLSVRPSSSRPGAPRLRDKLENQVSETDNVLLGKVHIISENTDNDEEDEGNLVIVEQQGSELQSENDTNESKYIIQNEHGHLVQQILDSQKQLSQVSGKTEIEWQFGVQKAKEAQYQEIEQLRFNIQAVSRVANPLGKLLDHIQEDVEVMRQEQHQWKNIYDEVSKEIAKQKSLNEDSLQPLQAKLKQLSIETEEKSDKICDMKILIHKNATRIEKLLTGGNVQ